MDISSFSFSSTISNFASTFDVEGNTSIDQADVIVVADYPIDYTSHLLNIQLLNQIWNHHLVLVDHVALRKSIPVDEDRRLFGLHKWINIQGFDIPGLADKIKKWKKQEELIKTFIKNCREKAENEDLDILEELEAFFIKNASKDEFSSSLIELNFEKVKEIILPLFSSVRFLKIHQLFLNLILEEQIGFYKKSFQTRQKLLQQSIDEQCKNQQKIIVFVNASLVIQNPALVDPEFDISCVKQCLLKKKYVIINPKNMPFGVQKNYPDLWNKTVLASNSIGDNKVHSPVPQRKVPTQVKNFLDS